ncbi:cytochrome C assembly family protein [Orientia chuto str. Dubai]|uniref:Cytochrome C assembly family protein n=1 Tax=Orientia chuto str. Dubai TaxID=1359168 RepID=A0A0F3MMB3_9RICK|nr:cytochrome c-type biogenesis CcmF C-terminal domain-containing protein [Candidatus Orientia mediorientalis]KJV56885.1 cytochrome C assembly family protein [Orientia chuto str. Dubai]
MLASSIGSYLLISAIVLYSINLGYFFLCTNINLLKIIHIVASVNVILAFCILVFSFIISDFTIQNVLLNSSVIMPLVYKISGAWASHEGSMLLWSSFLCIASIYSLFTCYFKFQCEKLVIAYQGLIILVFTGLVYFAFNPFIGKLSRNEIGLGLNPILQDIGLVFHPLILFFAYACYLIPFVYNVIALLCYDHALVLIDKAILFSKIGWLSLTVSIALGSWWAYRELGWGGYWFFDPVENISLMPWLSATIYHHSLLYARFNNILLRCSILSAITTFLLCILGTFLVRSDILISVHSFSLTDSKVNFILIFFIVLSVSSLGLYILRISKFFSNTNTSLSIKELLILLGNVLWLSALIVILISIFYPIFYKLIYGNKISIGYSYFISTFIPIILLTALLAGSIYSQKSNYYRVIIALSISGIIIYFSYRNLSIASLAIFCSIYLIQESLCYLIKSCNYFTIKIPYKVLVVTISHLGFGILILSISLNANFQHDTDFIGKIGSTIHNNGLSITLRNISYAKGPNYFKQIAEFWVENDKEIFILKPENRYYIVESIAVPESDIYSTLLYDIYVVLSKVDTDTVYAKIYYRPFMAMLWIGVALISIGMLFSVTTTRKNPKFDSN